MNIVDIPSAYNAIERSGGKTYINDDECLSPYTAVDAIGHIEEVTGINWTSVYIHIGDLASKGARKLVHINKDVEKKNITVE